MKFGIDKNEEIQNYHYCILTFSIIKTTLSLCWPNKTFFIFESQKGYSKLKKVYRFRILLISWQHLASLSIPPFFEF